MNKHILSIHDISYPFSPRKFTESHAIFGAIWTREDILHEFHKKFFDIRLKNINWAKIKYSKSPNSEMSRINQLEQRLDNINKSSNNYHNQTIDLIEMVNQSSYLYEQANKEEKVRILKMLCSDLFFV